jgi:hypothetical protein
MEVFNNNYSKMATMKTPKEKAKELVEKFKPYMYCYMGSGMLSNDYENVVLDFAKKSSLIAVDEIIETAPKLDKRIYKNDCSWIEALCNTDYWQEVKSEIEKL